MGKTPENFGVVGGRMVTACSFCPDSEDCKRVRVLCPTYVNFKVKEVRVNG